MATRIQNSFVVPPVSTSSVGALGSGLNVLESDLTKRVGTLMTDAFEQVGSALAKDLQSLLGGGCAAPASKPAIESPDFIVRPGELESGAKIDDGSRHKGKPKPTNINTGHLTNHGGGVLAQPNVVPVYLGDYFQTSAGQADKAHNDAALADLVKNPGITGIWGRSTAWARAPRALRWSSADPTPR